MSTKTVEQIDAEIKKLQDARAEVVRLNKGKKLRHGDYGIANNSNPRLIVTNSLEQHGVSGLGKGCIAKLTEPTGNIFDDLEVAGPDGMLLPLTKEEALEFMDHRRGETYTFGPNFDKLKKRIEAKLK